MIASHYSTRTIWSWAWFDWANSAFATVVIAGFFPVFFKQFWASDLPATTSTFWLGVASSGASLTIVLCAPLLGALADSLNAKKRFLLLFTALGILASALLFFLAHGHWVLALICYVLGLWGFSGSNIFYDALLPDIAPPQHYERISSLGYALGYLGGGLLFLLNIIMTRYPDWFGLADVSEAVRWSFASVALWWAVFTIPVILWVPEPGHKPSQPLTTMWHEAIQALRLTARQVRQLPHTVQFLIAYWCYIDGVDTIVRMAVDYGLALGFAASDLMVALLLTQLIGFPAALGFGYLGTRFGAKPILLLAIGGYLGIVIAASQLQDVYGFYGLAMAIGLIQGGIQALSRAFFARLIPPGRGAEFFGFFNMVGKFAAVLGPALIAITAALTDDSRLSLLPVALLFILGGALLWRVDPKVGQADAQNTH
jgi:UMF1 family MFS transporter